MAKRDILKEAIADAKAVKETAIANAKAALEEAFTPQLKSMLAAKLEEMELDEEENIDEAEPLTPNKDMRKPGDRDVEDGAEEEKTEKEKESMEEEIDLDEILKEIEGELTKEETVTEEEVTEESEAERADVDKYEYEEGKEEGEEDEAEELDLDDMTDEDLKGFIEDVIADMVASGELEAGENAEESEEEDIEVDTDGVDVDMETEETEEIELEEETTEEVTEEAKEESEEEIKEDDSIAEVYKEKNNKELEEAHSTIATLRSELNEVNLLNAKLLYTNKIFKAKSLTENEKVKVLGAFDKATTVKETKLVFETLNEGLKRKKSPIRESLGSASKATGNFKTKKPIIAADPMVERFQKLAGLK
tara:strand:- start:1025 stop:2116 length:1092 start_codon:yes stop_codon:yes gene_type:complete